MLAPSFVLRRPQRLVTADRLYANTNGGNPLGNLYHGMSRLQNKKDERQLKTETAAFIAPKINEVTDWKDNQDVLPPCRSHAVGRGGFTMATTNKVFFGFGLSDNMFPSGVTNLRRRDLSPEEAGEVIKGGVEVCLNPSHAETIRVMRDRFGIDVPIPAKAPIVALKAGDRLLVMGVSGLPRLEGRHEYTPEEVAGARFRFGLYELETVADRVRAAFGNSDQGYLERCVAQRQPGPGGAGSRFLEATSLGEIRDAAWEAYSHPQVAAPAVAFRAPLRGRFGLVRLDSLQSETAVVLDDRKATGQVMPVVSGVMGPEVDFTVLLLGPDRETGKEVVWTFFPGEPISPSSVPAAGNAGRQVTAAEAIGLGLEWAKIE